MVMMSAKTRFSSEVVDSSRERLNVYDFVSCVSQAYVGLCHVYLGFLTWEGNGGGMLCGVLYCNIR